jgi:hypothetical protein
MTRLRSKALYGYNEDLTLTAAALIFLFITDNLYVLFHVVSCRALITIIIHNLTSV